jgi:predicted double-glycine peptidase
MISMPVDFPCCPVYERADTPDPDAIILNSVPKVIQSTGYSCGASSLQAVLMYWGVCTEERELLEPLETSQDMGTAPEKIVDVAISYGLEASLLEQITTDDLKRSIENRIPVIIIAQAWNGYEKDGIWVTIRPERWEEVWNDGHYMVVIGVDSRNVYFEDPALLGTRGAIPIEEFLSRWHFSREGDNPDEQTRIYIHPAIIIAGNRPASHPDYTWIS